MKLSKKTVIIIAVVIVLLIGGGIAFATSTPAARVNHQLNLGNKYLQEGKYQEAILAFQKVIEIEPKNIPARLGLGNAYIATDEFAKAEAILKEVIDIDPNNIPAREELFNVYVKEGNLESAKSILEEISALNPDIDLKQFNTDLDLAQAISVSKVSYDQGIKQMNDKQYLEAMDSFQKVIKEDNQRYNDAQVKIGECKTTFTEETLQKAKDAATNKDYKVALDFLEQVLKVDPNNQDALKLKGDYTIEAQSAAKTAFGPNDFKVVGVKLGMDEQSVVGNLGQPTNRVIGQDKNSGVTYIAYVYDWGKLYFKQNNDQTTSLFMATVTSPGVSGPRNTNVGDSVQSVLDKFRRDQNTSPNNSWLYGNYESGSWGSVGYDEDNIMVNIGYGYGDPGTSGVSQYILEYDTANGKIKRILLHSPNLPGLFYIPGSVFFKYQQ